MTRTKYRMATVATVLPVVIVMGAVSVAQAFEIEGDYSKLTGNLDVKLTFEQEKEKKFNDLHVPVREADWLAWQAHRKDPDTYDCPFRVRRKATGTVEPKGTWEIQGVSRSENKPYTYWLDLKRDKDGDIVDNSWEELYLDGPTKNRGGQGIINLTLNGKVLGEQGVFTETYVPEPSALAGLLTGVPLAFSRRRAA